MHVFTRFKYIKILLFKRIYVKIKKANLGLKKNRTKIQMVLTALVILSVVRQFFLGNYNNMFLGILTLMLFMVPQFLDRKLNVTKPP